MSTIIDKLRESVADESRPTLSALEGGLGFLPHLFTALASSPQALEAYVAVNAAYEASSLSRHEQQVVLIASSVVNECAYCVAGHTTFARSLGVPEHVIDAVRDGTRIPDERLEAIHRLARTMVGGRGTVSRGVLDAFYDAGLDQRQAREVLIGVVLKTFSNYVAKMLDLPLDPEFEAGAWRIPEQAA